MTDDDLIEAILDAAKELEDERFDHDLGTDIVVTRAAERLVEIIGDMVSRFSDSFKAAHPEIEYQDAKRMCNILAHHYQKVAAARVGETIRVDIPELVAQITDITGNPDRPT